MNRSSGKPATLVAAPHAPTAKMLERRMRGYLLGLLARPRRSTTRTASGASGPTRPNSQTGWYLRDKAIRPCMTS